MRASVRRDHVDVDDAHGARWVEAPRPDVTLMLTLSGWLLEDGERLPDTWLAAPSARSCVVEMSPAYSCVDVKLHPLGAYTLVGRPLDELGSGALSLDDLFGAAGSRLGERALAAGHWRARLAAIDEFLADRLERGPSPSPAVAWAFSRLEATGGCMAIGELASELGWSRRHLVVKFREQAGLAPKAMARLLRFEGVLRRIDADAARWADIALDCGYCDQSHLNRDFRELLGTTPTEYVAQRLPRQAEVTFLQDADVAAL